MKINHECIRDLLLCIEANTTYFTPFSFNNNMCNKDTEIAELKKLIDTYGSESICYHLRYCEDGGLICNQTYQEDPSMGLYECYLTFYGHEFLDSIRDPKIWRIVKSAGSCAGSFSIEAIKTIASAYLTQVLPAILSQIH